MTYGEKRLAEMAGDAQDYNDKMLEKLNSGISDCER